MIDTSKFNSLLDVIKTFDTEQKCIDHLTVLRWDGNIVSPFDAESKVYVCKGNKYKCKNTGKYFNVKTNTLFDNTKIKLQKWFLAIYLVTSHKKGISSVQLGKDIGVTQKSAWFMLQRIRACFGGNDNEKLEGQVQVDETYVGGKISNMHQNSPIRKNSKNAGYEHKTPVLGMITDKKVIAKQINKSNIESIVPLIEKHIDKESILVTDNFGPYKTIGKEYKAHKIVRHGLGQYVFNGFHTNSIEGFWSHFKRSVIGIYHHVTPKHIQKYIDETSFRYNTRELNEAQRMNVLFANIENRTTYKNLING